MFGFIIGTLSLIGLIKVVRAGRYGGRGFRRGGPRRWMMRRLFERLDTTPGQEKVIGEVLEDVERKAWAAREQFFTARGSYARAVRGEHFDTAAVGEAFDAQQAAVEEVKKSLRDGFAKVHEALNGEQRKVLGDLIEFGPRAMHGCHRHRSHDSWRPTGGPAAVNL